jgi:DNA-binding CsgD family transcriptional regulator
MTTTLAARITAPEFQASLAAIGRYHEACSGVPADEVVAHLTLKLLEHGKADKTFGKQQDNYLKKYAAWQAKHFAEAARTYEKYVDPEKLDTPVAFDDDAPVYGELIADTHSSVEDQVAARFDLALVARAIGQLTDRPRQVGELLLAGKDPDQIAARLHLEPANVRKIISRIRFSLEAAGLAA